VARKKRIRVEGKMSRREGGREVRKAGLQ